MDILLPFLIVLLIILVPIFLFVMFGDGAAWIDWLDREKKGGVLEFIGITIGGVLLAIQATVSYQRVKAMENTAKAQADAAQAQANAAKAQADAAQAQAEAVEQQAKANQNTEQGQRQERLKNAIEHLGHGGPFMRLGGAYELFHLADDTEELRQTVLEIFCAYICRTTRNDAYQKEYGEKPSEEIQSLLNLLFVQKHDVFDKHRANLQGSRLNGASLPQARLQKTDLRNAQLQGAKLDHAQLQGADLSDAQLQGAELPYAQLQGVMLSRAQLQGADFRKARLQGADLLGARLQRAKLWETHLQGAALWYAQLQGAELFGAQLQGANLIYAHLQGADLSEVQLQGIVSSGDIESQWDNFSFAEHIRQRIDQDSDYDTVVFSGGLNEDEVNNITKGIPDSKSVGLKEKLKPHIDQLASNELPSGVDIGRYTEEDAERWIKEYEEAINRDDVHS